MQIRCNFPDISYLSETQKNNFQFLNILHKKVSGDAIWSQTVWTYVYIWPWPFYSNAILAIIEQNMKHICQKYKKGWYYSLLCRF